MEYFERVGVPVNRSVAAGETVYFTDPADQYSTFVTGFAWQKEDPPPGTTPGGQPPTFCLKGTLKHDLPMQSTKWVRDKNASLTLFEGSFDPASYIDPASWVEL